MSQKYVTFENGEKLSLEDLLELARVGGVADDFTNVHLRKIHVEGTKPRGSVIPWEDGPLVSGYDLSGSTVNGGVYVRRFKAFISPDGATSGEGTEAASGGDSITDLLSGVYGGGSVLLTTPLSGAGKMRWDLLYATVAQASVDSAPRLKKNAVTKVISSSSMFTRKNVAVTLGWVQGTEASTGAGAYPALSMPVLPTPGAGQANIPLTLVRVQYAATMGLQTYDKHSIANCAPIARFNTQNGAPVLAMAGVSGKADAGSGASFSTDPVELITGTTASGGWPLTGNRPEQFLEPGAGLVQLGIPLGPFKATATKTFGTTVTLLSAPISKFGHFTDQFRDEKPFDFRNREFLSIWYWYATGTMGFAHAAGASGQLIPQSPAFISNSAQNIQQRQPISWGQSYKNDILGTYRNAGQCIVGDITTNNDILYLVVDSATGYLHLAAVAAAGGGSDYVNGGRGFVYLIAFPSRFAP